MATSTSYVLFAILSTIANLLTQELVVRLARAAPVLLSIVCGTVVGFALKYALDKLFVFQDAFAGALAEARKITLYGLFSVVTTLVFWAVEMSFWALWRTDLAKYIGAVIGLSIGYAAKFLLDRRFVFRDRSA